MRLAVEHRREKLRVRDALVVRVVDRVKNILDLLGRMTVLRQDILQLLERDVALAARVDGSESLPQCSHTISLGPMRDDHEAHPPNSGGGRVLP